MTEWEEFLDILNPIADSTDTDYFLFSNAIFEDQADKLISEIRKIENRRANAALILCTNGGDPDAAYQACRCLKKSYKKLSLYVFGACKSAGTLLAVGANEIIISEFGHLGPLDIQLADKEELYGQTAALDVQQSLSTLAKFAYDNFFSTFLKLEPGRALSTKTANEIAKSLTLGLVNPIAAQIDPLLLGRVDRSMKIAEAYIDRLAPGFKGKSQIVGGYPSHGFVIDYQEAKGIFDGVIPIREPNQVEKTLENYLRKWSKVPKQDNWIGILSTPKAIPNDSTAKPADNGAKHGSSAAGSNPSLPAQKKRKKARSK